MGVDDITTINNEKNIKYIAAFPCFNVEDSIGDLVRRAQKHVDMVVVVDDGSSDNTGRIAKENGALVVQHKINQGYGSAINSCLLEAKANNAVVLVILDGDGQHNPDDIPLLLYPIINGEADLAIGSRSFRNNKTMPNYRKFGILIISFLWNFGSKKKVNDTQSGFRSYNGSLIEGLSLHEKGMSVSIEILEQARRKDAVIKEVTISCFYGRRTFGLKALKQGIVVALSVVRIRLGR